MNPCFWSLIFPIPWMLHVEQNSSSSRLRYFLSPIWNLIFSKLIIVHNLIVSIVLSVEYVTRQVNSFEFSQHLKKFLFPMRNITFKHKRIVNDIGIITNCWFGVFVVIRCLSLIPRKKLKQPSKYAGFVKTSKNDFFVN